MKELGSQLVLTRSGATRLADKLAAAHLVERQRSHDDRRGVTLTLTEQGPKRPAEGPVYARGIRNGFLAKLSSDKIATLKTALSRVAPMDRTAGEE